jgi:signal transduction histidine kinase/CheY-like chemotaxis protein/HPt (histidine-containing phosphotransfer) domain-containing protein
MIVGYLRDLRELKAVLHEIRKENAKSKAMSYWYESILNAVPLPIAVMNTQSQWTFINTAVEKYFGKTINEGVGKPCSNLGASICNTGDCGIACAQKGVYQTFFTEGGLSYQVDVAVLNDLSGTIQGYVEVMQDITNLKMMTKKQADAESANSAKTAFLAQVSHELRTPLNAVLGIAEIQLQDDMLPPNIAEAFGRIYQSGAMLLGLINDILDLSKIEVGKLDLTPCKYDVASLLKDTAQANLLRIGSKPVAFYLEIDPAIPAELFGDELRIKQVLNNLLSNAMKYTKEGWVKFTAESDSLHTADTQITLVFRVQDTGPGMTDEQIRHLYDEYSRFNAEENRAIEGTGLGMHITKYLVELMGGEILVESRPNQGTIFTVRLPQERMGKREIGAHTAEEFRWFRLQKNQIWHEPMPYGNVLVVDDLDSNIYVAKGLLAPYKLSVDIAPGGVEALAKIKEGRVYDIIFMDHLMPVMNGMEATRQIRALEYTQPIIALTANAVAGQAEMFLANGFDGFISKPIDIRRLDAALLKYIRDKQPPEVIEAARMSMVEPYEGAAQLSDAISPQLAEIFLRDAAKILGDLEAACQNNEAIDKGIFGLHAIKGALANIGEMRLSMLADSLEQAGKSKNISVMKTGMPSFLDLLRKVIEKLSRIQEEDTFADALTAENAEYLVCRLQTIRSACDAYDPRIIKSMLGELRQKTWTRAVSGMLKDIARHLLHSEYTEIEEIVKAYTGQYTKSPKGKERA